jgi:2,3-bisphosphoglycerate-independent phosphoglycerate mutase
LITADHGTVEKWYYPDGAIDTGHTDSRVPLIMVPPEGEDPIPLMPKGDLTDVAPTVLSLLGLPLPREMTGKSLLDGHPSGNPRRLLMVILDGWGLGDNPEMDLIQVADTPIWDGLRDTLPLAGLEASGEAVGLPPGTVGNSESGHLHLGAGRKVFSDRVRIDRALDDGSFFENEAFLGSMNAARERKKALHFMGIVSFYSSHGSLPHLLALMDMARRKGMPEVYIHSFLGRRGERPESGAAYMAGLESLAETHDLGRVVSCIGRYWALDREENWDRVERTYRLMVHGQGRPVKMK